MTVATAGSIEAAATFRLLALALAPPTSVTVAEVGALAGVLAERRGAAPELRTLARAAVCSVPDEVAVAHERLFAADAEASPYEGGYERDPFRQTRTMADVAGFYAAFGAAAHGAAAERPDHAGTELEFLGFLELRRLEAEQSGRADEAARCEEIEAAFLAEHAGRWLPVFFGTLAETARDEYHRALGTLGRASIARELERRGLTVEPMQRRARTRLSVEADELECGTAEEVRPVGSDPGRRGGQTPRV